MSEPVRPDRPESRYDLLDSVRREVAREKRASRELQRVEDGEISLAELQGSLTPAPPRLRARKPRVAPEPVYDESRSGAVFMAMSAMMLIVTTVLALGFLSLFAIASQLLAF